MAKKEKRYPAYCRRCGRPLPSLAPCSCVLPVMPEVMWKTSKLSIRKSLTLIKKKADRDN